MQINMQVVKRQIDNTVISTMPISFKSYVLKPVLSIFACNSTMNVGPG